MVNVIFQAGAKVYAAPADAERLVDDSHGVPVVLTADGVGPMTLLGSIAADPCPEDDS